MLKGSILQKLETAHRDSKRPLNLGVYYKNTLVALCHALEDFILQSKSSPLVIAAFQQGKWYLQEAERYGEIAKQASGIAIMAAPDTGFAEHPTKAKSNVALVDLKPDDPVAQEWHLIILSPSYTAMVLCQELSESEYGSLGLPEADLERKFYGFWTFEPGLVWEAGRLAIAHIGNYDQALQKTLKERLEAMKAEFGTHPQEDVGIVVSQVLDYLQTRQEQLSQPQAPEESYLSTSQALDDNLVSNEMQAFLRMAQLIDQADATNPMAAGEVAALAETMAQLLDLPAWQQKRLRLASLLHGLVSFLGTAVPSEEEEAAPSCTLSCPLEPGIQALRTRPRLCEIARIITHQTERWDGTGTPGELAYDAIPLESRILALVTYFQRRVNDIRTYESGEGKPTPTREETLSQALAECQAKASEVFDPKLVETLVIMVMGMQQGMNIQTSQPKIAAGMWLLDAYPTEETQMKTSSTKA